MLSRIGGKLCFAVLRDGAGDIQVMISLAGVGAERLAAWKRDVDLGDHVGVTGGVIASRSGELSVLASSWTLTARSLWPLPEKFRGLTDPGSRVRQGCVDLIVNPGAWRSVELRGGHALDPFPVERARLPRGGDAGPDLAARRGERAALRDPLTPTAAGYTCGSRWNWISSGWSSAGSSGCIRIGRIFRIRAPMPRTTPSSPCLRSTRRTAITPRSGS
jgi:hypothetical protein